MNTGSERSAQNKKLHQAVEQVMQTWLPVNQIVLMQLRRELLDNQCSIEDVLHYIKADPCLFSNCVRKLLADPDTKTYPNHILMLLKTAGTSVIEQILDELQSTLRTFTGLSARPLQAETMKQIIAAQTAAEIFADELQVDPELAIAVSILSNLGLLLLVWNYPDDIEAACNLAKNKRYSLHDALIQILGYSPQLLTEAVLTRIDVGDELIDTIARLNFGTNVHNNIHSEPLLILLEYAYAFSTSQNQFLYPDDASQWQMVQGEISAALGSEVATRVTKRIYRKLQRYTFTGFISSSDEDACHYGFTLKAKNRYLPQCPEPLQTALSACYENIESCTASLQALNAITRTILPAAHFKNGALYLLNTTRQTLTARYQIGERGLEFFPEYHLAEEFDSSHPILAGYYSAWPVMQMDSLSEEPALSSIACSIQTPTTQGVLYLELDTAFHQAEGLDSLTIYKAVMILIQHALGIE